MRAKKISKRVEHAYDGVVQESPHRSRTEEPAQRMVHVPVCGGAGWVATGLTRKVKSYGKTCENDPSVGLHGVFAVESERYLPRGQAS